MSQRSDTAVCVVRAERQTDGLLVTVIVTRDVATGLQDPPRRFTDAAGASAAVAAFLESVEKEHR